METCAAPAAQAFLRLMVTAPQRATDALRDALQCTGSLPVDATWSGVSSDARVYTRTSTCAEPCTRVLLCVHGTTITPRGADSYHTTGTVLGALGTDASAPWCVWPDGGGATQPLWCAPPSSASDVELGGGGVVQATLCGVLPRSSGTPSVAAVRWLLTALPSTVCDEVAHAAIART